MFLVLFLSILEFPEFPPILIIIIRMPMFRKLLKTYQIQKVSSNLLCVWIVLLGISWFPFSQRRMFMPDIYSSKDLFTPCLNNNENDLISYYYTVKWTHFANYNIDFKSSTAAATATVCVSGAECVRHTECLSFSVRANIWLWHDQDSAKRYTINTNTNKWNQMKQKLI